MVGRTSAKKRRSKAFLGVDLFVAFLMARQLFVIDRGRFHIQFLRGNRGLNHRFDLRLIDVRLVDHIRDFRRLSRFPTEEVNFVKDPECLVRVDRSEGEVIIRIAPVVKVKPAKHAEIQEPGDDLLDILGQVMVAGVDQHSSLGTNFLGNDVRHTPIRQVGVVERRLKRFVLQQDLLVSS